MSRASKVNRETRILELLETGPMSQQEVVERLAAQEAVSSVYRSIRELEAVGLVVITGRGKQQRIQLNEKISSENEKISSENEKISSENEKISNPLTELPSEAEWHRTFALAEPEPPPPEPSEDDLRLRQTIGAELLRSPLRHHHLLISYPGCQPILDAMQDEGLISYYVALDHSVAKLTTAGKLAFAPRPKQTPKKTYAPGEEPRLIPFDPVAAEAAAPPRYEVGPEPAKDAPQEEWDAYADRLRESLRRL